MYSIQNLLMFQKAKQFGGKDQINYSIMPLTRLKILWNKVMHVYKTKILVWQEIHFFANI